jgi:hypothetical protein
MTAREALASLRQREGHHRPIRLRTEPLIAHAAAQLEKQFGAHPSVPSTDQIKALKERFWAVGWSDVHPRDWQQAPWVMLDGPPYLVDVPGFLVALRRELARMRLSGGYRRLIYVYLRDFLPNLPAIQKTADMIQDGLSSIDLPSLQKWKAAHERFRLFAPKDGPRRVAREILQAQSNPDGVLAAAELKGELAGPAGFAGVVHSEVLDQLMGLFPKSSIPLAKLSSLFTSFENGEQLRYPEKRPKLAETLLVPWSSSNSPRPDIQKAIFEFLLKHLKDPRLHRGNWHGVSAAAIAVMRRWLTRVTLEEFFELIDQFALDEHWRHRRAFWMAYYKRGMLDDAWIVLGTNAHHAAKTSLEKNLGFGRLRSGAQASQSVLIVKIQNLVFAEWTHNGKCRAWLDSDKRAPRLDQALYDRADLVQDSLLIDQRYSEPGISHINSEAGHWQSILAQFIHRRTNIRLQTSEYMIGAKR